MIIGRARLKTIVAGQFGLNWYAIDRRCVRRGQGEIAEQAVAFRRKGFGGCSASERSAYQPGRSRARWMALNTWLGKNGLERKPSGCAAWARSVVWGSISPERKIAGTAIFARSWQASSMPSIGP